MRRSMGTIPAVLTISICVLALLASIAGPTSRASGGIKGPVGIQAKTVDLVENANLKLISEEGAALVEHGQATGTYKAPVTATFTIHPKAVTATVTVYPHGGSITGVAQANYVVQNSTGYFGGTLTITHGTGSFAHASGKALGISGTIDRYNFAITVRAHGEANL
ncbi:MAG TPA: hypothetical protein VK730_12095 [Solirubrobacteraceae bacterium]|jgi:hypothetical protein|nr:hypothetical protein [Solirubrobacteraceae bacterium]